MTEHEPRLPHGSFRSSGGTLTCECGERITDDEAMSDDELTTIVKWLWHRVDEMEAAR